jgi:hypothetical protein
VEQTQTSMHSRPYRCLIYQLQTPTSLPPIEYMFLCLLVRSITLRHCLFPGLFISQLAHVTLPKGDDFELYIWEDVEWSWPTLGNSID